MTGTGISMLLDLFRKNPSFYSHFPASATVSAAAASFAFSGTAIGSRFLLSCPNSVTVNASVPRIPVAYCDAGAELPDVFIPSDPAILSGKVFPTDDFVASDSNKKKASEVYLRDDSVDYVPKQYNLELKPLFSALEWRQLGLTCLRSFLMYYLPLLEPSLKTEEDDDDFLQDVEEGRRVDLVVPFQKSVKQIVRETTVVTTRRVLERVAVHYCSQRMAWKLLKDVRKSAMRKSQRGMPTSVYFFNVSRTTFRGHCLGVAASWIVQVGIEVYRFCRRLLKTEEESDIVEVETSQEVKLLGKKVTGVTIRCGASLVFASIGAGVGAILIRPSTGQWIGCALGDLAGPIVVSVLVDKYLKL
ncbi:hypothetical protein Tsubulata_022612 [Turnera subulata]|uniref:Uncharacterized protein n=1 Tax=Turnera subulata TaxID=218843 RepID=A0A9Q0FBV6_9ROSI|nr:hypothetical protein Tsubulata_022612 [Turnera subulata]